MGDSGCGIFPKLLEVFGIQPFEILAFGLYKLVGLLIELVRVVKEVERPYGVLVVINVTNSASTNAKFLANFSKQSGANRFALALRM